MELGSAGGGMCRCGWRVIVVCGLDLIPIMRVRGAAMV